MYLVFDKLCKQIIKINKLDLKDYNSIMSKKLSAMP